MRGARGDLEANYRDFTGIHSSFTDTWYVRKKQVMEEIFESDIRSLSFRLGRLAAFDRLGRDIPMRELVRGLKEITARLGIYRTYCRSFELSKRDRLVYRRSDSSRPRSNAIAGCVGARV